MDTPILSIAIPTFHRAELLKETVERICAQAQGKPVEVCIADNASPDRTAAVAEELAATYSFVRYVRHPSNLGPDRNIAEAARLARGTFVWFFGDDDELLPGAVDQVLAAIRRHPDVDVVYVNWLNRRHPARDVLVRGGDAFVRQTLTAASFLGSVVVRRSRWENVDPTPYVGTRFLHLHVLLDVLPTATSYCISRRLVNPMAPAAAGAHWVLGSEALRIFYLALPEAFRRAALTGRYSARVVDRAVARHMASLPRALLVMRSQGVIDPAVLREVRATNPGHPLWWGAVLVASQMPGSVARGLRASRRWLRRAVRA